MNLVNKIKKALGRAYMSKIENSVKKRVNEIRLQEKGIANQLDEFLKAEFPDLYRKMCTVGNGPLVQVDFDQTGDILGMDVSFRFEININKDEVKEWV